MGSSGTVFGIIGIILAAGAIGFAFIVWNGQNTTNSDLDDLTDQLNNLAAPTNTTDPPDLTEEFNNLTSEFNNLTDMFNSLTDEFNNLTGTLIVGKWDALNDNYDTSPYNVQYDWLFEFGDKDMINYDYIAVSNPNTRISLLKPGWYKIQLSVLLWYLSVNEVYLIRVLKDGDLEFYLDRLETENTIDNYWHIIDSSAFVYSDGTNYIEINARSLGDLNFRPSDNQLFHQLSIEYVAL